MVNLPEKLKAGVTVRLVKADFDMAAACNSFGNEHADPSLFYEPSKPRAKKYMVAPGSYDPDNAAYHRNFPFTVPAQFREPLRRIFAIEKLEHAGTPDNVGRCVVSISQGQDDTPEFPHFTACINDYHQNHEPARRQYVLCSAEFIAFDGSVKIPTYQPDQIAILKSSLGARFMQDRTANLVKVPPGTIAVMDNYTVRQYPVGERTVLTATFG